MATRLSTSTATNGVINQTPEALLAQAKRVDSSTSMEEYALARIVASEGGSEPAAIQRLLAACDVNRARAAGRTMLKHCAPDGKFGRQGTGSPKRPVSTSLDPSTSHLAIARELLATSAPARGAIAYFNPRTQYQCWASPMKCVAKDASPGTKNFNQHPLDVLESWSYVRSRLGCDRDEKGRYRCSYGPRRGTSMEWIGQLEGVDPYRLLAFRATATPGHDEVTLAARNVILRGISGSSSAPGGGSVSLPFKAGGPALTLVGLLAASGTLYMLATSG